MDTEPILAPLGRRVPVLRSAYHNLRELPHVREITARNGLRPLTARDLRTLRDDAIGRLGSSVYLSGLALYAAIAGEIRQGWIPARFMWDRVTPALNGALHRHTGMRRTLMGRFFDPVCLPDVAYRVRNRWYGPDSQPTVLSESLAGWLDMERFVLKEEGSRQARGTTIVTRDEIVRADAARGPDAVLQRLIVQHESLAELSPGGIAPIRVLTTSDTEGVRVLAVMVRVGVSGNAVVGTASDIRLAVALDGGLHPIGIDAQHTLFDRHPVTGISFEGRTVPGLHKALDLSRSLHAALPQVGLAGWDLTIGPDEHPWLLECNTVHPGVHYNEMLAGPAFITERWERFATTG